MTPHTYLEHGLTIFHTRLQHPGGEFRESFRSPTRPFLTISRETCAGATTLGRQLVPLLDAHLGEEGRSWMFLDKDLLTQALTTNHLPQQLAAYLPEDRLSDIKSLIGEIVGLHPPLWELEQRVNEAIHQFARLGHVIFAGRAAHLIINTESIPPATAAQLVLRSFRFPPSPAQFPSAPARSRPNKAPTSSRPSIFSTQSSAP